MKRNVCVEKLGWIVRGVENEREGVESEREREREWGMRGKERGSGEREGKGEGVESEREREREW